jgi:hypothetical protein
MADPTEQQVVAWLDATFTPSSDAGIDPTGSHAPLALAIGLMDQRVSAANAPHATHGIG